MPESHPLLALYLSYFTNAGCRRFTFSRDRRFRVVLQVHVARAGSKVVSVRFLHSLNRCRSVSVSVPAGADPAL